MKRALTITLAASLLFAACGGGDDAESIAADILADAGADGAGGAVQPGLVVSSLDDIPDVCKQQMTAFLKAVEPVVSGINWETATMQDFQAIEAEFSKISDDFDTAATDTGCDDMAFAGPGEFELLAAFAGQVAPGTAGFLQFLNGFGSFDDEPAAALPDAPPSDPAAPDDVTALPDEVAADIGALGAEGEFASCDEAIAWVEDLMAQYDSMMNVPAGELMRFATLGVIMMDCTPAQMEFFSSTEVAAFFGDS